MQLTMLKALQRKGDTSIGHYLVTALLLRLFGGYYLRKRLLFQGLSAQRCLGQRKVRTSQFVAGV